jgi:hypothetical protein
MLVRIVAGYGSAGYIKVQGEVLGYVAVVTFGPPSAGGIIPAKGCAGEGMFSTSLGDGFLPEGFNDFQCVVADTSGHWRTSYVVLVVVGEGASISSLH